MTAPVEISDEQRPRDFSARYVRSRQGSVSSGSRKRFRGKHAMALAGAIALPAFAAPSQWDRFEIGDAGESQVELEPMPFEKAGSSFPGSAFYYLEYDEAAPGLGEGIRSDADIDHSQGRIDHGPAASALRIDNSGVDRTRALECMTAAIYYEARSEPDSGQRAVAQVVLNRVAHPSYPSTVCGVVFQGSQRSTGCQLTFTCDGSLARRPERLLWLRAENVARAALGGYVHRSAGLATHYHTVQVNPRWAPKLNYLGTIGTHRFYRFRGSAGLPEAFRFAYLGGEPSAKILAAEKPDADGLEHASVVARSSLVIQLDGYSSPAPSNGAFVNRELPARDLENPQESDLRADRLPAASGIKPEYRNSGRWIAKPGA